jgi:hypothetical protein
MISDRYKNVFWVILAMVESQPLRKAEILENGKNVSS